MGRSPGESLQGCLCGSKLTLSFPPPCADQQFRPPPRAGPRGCACSSLVSEAAAGRSAGPAHSRPAGPPVCLSVCLCPALPPSSPLTPLLTCPPAPDEQSIWNVTVLPNSKWANITWKHNLGPGTDFVVEYTDSKHCCAGGGGGGRGGWRDAVRGPASSPGAARPVSWAWRPSATERAARWGRGSGGKGLRQP